ncbi:CPK20 [Symbiodinium sp. KB8]|nr:CPK20 [Symbiodinium sp. KB8]
MFTRTIYSQASIICLPGDFLYFNNKRYRCFLEAISEDTGAVIVATPCAATLDHDAAAREVAKLLDAALGSLQQRGVQVASLPIWGLGHSSGAVIQLLISLHHRRAGLLLLAVAPAPNPFLKALPRPPPAQRRALSQLRRRLEEVADQGELRRGLRTIEAATRGLARTLRSLRSAGEEDTSWEARLLQAMEDSEIGEVSKLLRQVLPAGGEVLEGARDLKPSRQDLAARLGTEEARKVLPKRLLVVEFGDDPQDDSSWLLSALGCEEQRMPREEDPFSLGWDPLDAIDEALEQELEEAGFEEWEESEEQEEALGDDDEEEAPEVREARRQLEVEWEADASSSIQEWEEDPNQPRIVELVRMRGGSSAPIDFQDELQGLEGEVARFLRREPASPRPPGLALAGGFALKAHLFRLTAGTNRGFGPVSYKQRGDILACLSQLESISPAEALPPRGAMVSEKLFGKWRLMWSTAPAVLFLGALPFLECGEIHEDICRLPGASAAAGESQDVSLRTTAQLTPRGAALLSALPLPVAGLTTVSMRCSAKIVSARRLDLGEPVAEVSLPGLPPAALPLSDTASLSLTTTFLDDELRISRTSLGETLLWLRVESK